MTYPEQSDDAVKIPKEERRLLLKNSGVWGIISTSYKLTNSYSKKKALLAVTEGIVPCLVKHPVLIPYFFYWGRGNLEQYNWCIFSLLFYVV